MSQTEKTVLTGQVWHVDEYQLPVGATMKTRFAIVSRDTLTCESEPGQLIEIGKTYELIRMEYEERFVNDSDEDFRSGKLGFYAKSREDHLDSIAMQEFMRQFNYSLAGAVMDSIKNGVEPGRKSTVTFEFVEMTDKEWDDNEKYWEERGY